MADYELGQHLPSEVYDKVVVRGPVDFVDKYQDFLGATDEKDIIANAVGPLLLEGTVLDVGAGTGDIPDKLHLDPAKYTAVEQSPELVEILRAKGYDTIKNLFPCELPRTYDNVLMSHVLFGIEQCDAMIDPAWESVSEGGQLAVVTFRDNLDDYNKLLHQLGHTRRVSTDVRFNYLQEKFSLLGETALNTTQSHIYSPDIEGLATSISFIATNTPVGTPEYRAELHDKIVSEQPYLDELYRTENGYQFPMEHYIFTTHKAEL